MRLALRCTPRAKERIQIKQLPVAKTPSICQVLFIVRLGMNDAKCGAVCGGFTVWGGFRRDALGPLASVWSLQEAMRALQLRRAAERERISFLVYDADDTVCSTPGTDLLYPSSLGDSLAPSGTESSSDLKANLCAAYDGDLLRQSSMGDVQEPPRAQSTGEMKGAGGPSASHALGHASNPQPSAE